MDERILLHYKIIRRLGKGGMGDVYLAEDTKLGRQVALKILPAEFASDPDRVARFKTEAKATAALNHPNIAQIYSIEDIGQRIFIAMEYIDGDPLHALLPANGLPLHHFYEYFVPLADALAHAHERDVTHRDIKPNNVMVTRDNIPKILDFGLARLSQSSSISDEYSPETSTKSLTKMGTILGTPAYMSPEQAEGKRADYRSDIFSFGVMMYEAITGQRPFNGDSYAALISSILRDEPVAISTHKLHTPRDIARVITRCLQKDPQNRYRSTIDLRNTLKDLQEEISTDQDTPVMVTPPIGALSPPSRPRNLKGLWFSLVALGSVLLFWLIQQQWFAPPEPRLRKFTTRMETRHDVATISPDGNMVAYVQDGRLWRRDLSSTTPEEIVDLEGHAIPLPPFWSPGSDFIGYGLRMGGTVTLKRIAVAGGPSTTICALNNISSSGILGHATWGSDGMVVVEGGEVGLQTVPAQGGSIRVLASPDTSNEEVSFFEPSFLPDGRTLIFAAAREDNTSAIVVQSGETRKNLLTSAPGEDLLLPTYTSTGHILYNRASDIWAVPFSLSSLSITGEAFLVSEQSFLPSVSKDGTLVYQSRTAGGMQQLAWMDRNGDIIGSIGQPQLGLATPALSPDGRQVAVRALEQGNFDLWLQAVGRETKSRVSFNTSEDTQPQWTLNNLQIIFTSHRTGNGDIYRKASDGSDEAELLVDTPQSESAPHVSRDGRYLAYQVMSPDTKLDLWIKPMTTSENSQPFLQTPFNEVLPQISPDGRYVTYMSDESGEWEVYVKPFPQGDGKWPVSIRGGAHPRWNGRGDELFYVDTENNTLMAVRVSTVAEFSAGRPRALFTTENDEVRLYDGSAPYLSSYDVTDDGQRFVVIQDVGDESVEMVIVENWYEEFVGK